MNIEAKPAQNIHKNARETM